jgi:hypothetical protein
VRGAFEEDDDGKGPPPSESEVNANDDSRHKSPRVLPCLDGHWNAHDAHFSTIVVQAGEVWRNGHPCSGKLTKCPEKGTVTWQLASTVWTLKELCATEALWESDSNKPVIWQRPFGRLEKLLGEWLSQDGAHFEVTEQCVWRDGLRYKPIVVAHARDGGNVTWEDGGKKKWTLDVVNTTSRRLVWKQHDSRRTIFWRRQVEDEADLVGVWKASDGALITVNATGQITRAGKKLQKEETITFGSHSVDFMKYILNSQKSTRNVLVWDSGPGVRAGVLATIEWVREHCLPKSVEETYASENVLVHDCRDKTWKHWADKVAKHVNSICSRSFKKEKPVPGKDKKEVYTYRGVKPSHVQALLFSAIRRHGTGSSWWRRRTRSSASTDSPSLTTSGCTRTDGASTWTSCARGPRRRPRRASRSYSSAT